MSPLPPFDSLVAFEAALRLRSMTQAAAELGITQSAISHRIRRLESFMGTALVHRHNAGLAPTPAGEALAQELNHVLADVAGLKARCVSAAAPDRLKLGVDSALAQNWLLRRLSGFTAQNKDTSIELVIADSEGADRSAQFDVRLLWLPASETRATMTQRPLAQERVFPVCHPSLLPSGFTVSDASVLSTLPLLYKGLPGRTSGAEWSWNAWFERLGLPPPSKAALRFTSLGPAVSAAQERAGVVLARTLLVHDALADGRLTRILPPHEDIPCSKVYVIRWSRNDVGNPRVQRLVDWLTAKARDSVESAAAVG